MAAKTSSKQPRLQETRDVNAYFWTFVSYAENDVPAWGKKGRIAKLREYARDEPILAGALSTMVTKATALDWQITGGRNRVRRYQNILNEAEDGAGWSFLLDRWVQDYLVTDIGGVVELARDGRLGPVTGLYNLDSEALTLTGNVTAPIKYHPRIGKDRKSIPLKPGDFVRIVDLPTTDERKLGLGYCAVSRALKAAKVLLALYKYEAEQLADLPPQGIASITGMTTAEVKKAMDLYKAQMDAKNQQVFKGILWLAATGQMLQDIKVDLKPFSQLPQHFDKREAVELYVYTLSLDFGVDVREFWPASQAGATKAEAEVQHQKAKGKGFGRLLSDVERAVNWEVLPAGLEFKFDQQDSQDDLLKYQVRQTAIETVRKLWEPALALGEGLITTEEARRWLVEEGILPAWMNASDEINIHGIADKMLEERVKEARLQPGEEWVAMNSAGEIVTLWSSRSVHEMTLPSWRVLPAGGAPDNDPF